MDRKQQNDQSIHPRGRGGQKSNTCKPHKGGGKLEKRREALARRRLAHATTLNTLPRDSNPDGFRCPGSMNPHKCAPKGGKS